MVAYGASWTIEVGDIVISLDLLEYIEKTRVSNYIVHQILEKWLLLQNPCCHTKHGVKGALRPNYIYLDIL